MDFPIVSPSPFVTVTDISMSGQTVTAECPECSQSYRLKAELAGKKFRCKNCGGAITVPGPRRVSRAGGGPAAQRPQGRPQRRPVPSDESDPDDGYDADDDDPPPRSRRRDGLDDFDPYQSRLASSALGNAALPPRIKKPKPQRRRPDRTAGDSDGSRPSQRRSRSSGAPGGMVIGGVIGGAVLLVLILVGIGIGVPSVGQSLGPVLLFGGCGAMGIGHVWIMFAARAEGDILYYILIRLVPLASLFYAFTRWDELKVAVFLIAGGLALAGAGGGIIAAVGEPA